MTMQKYTPPPAPLMKAFEYCRDSVFILDRSERIVFVNTTFLEATGCGEEDLLQSPFGQTGYGRALLDGKRDCGAKLGADGEWRGEVLSRDASGGERWERAVLARTVEGDDVFFVGVCRDVTEERRFEEESAAMSLDDPSLGVPLIVFMDRLSQALSWAERAKKVVGVVVVRFNGADKGDGSDLLGREGGADEIIRRLRALLRRRDAVTRLDAEEFAIVLDAMAQPENMRRVLSRLREELTSVWSFGGFEWKPSAMMGTAEYPANGGDADALLDTAVYSLRPVEEY